MVKSRGQRLVLTLNRGLEIKSGHLWASIGRTTCTTKRKWRGLRRRWFVRLSAVTSGDLTNFNTYALQAWPASSKRACTFTRARRSTAYKTGVRAAPFSLAATATSAVRREHGASGVPTQVFRRRCVGQSTQPLSDDVFALNDPRAAFRPIPRE